MNTRKARTSHRHILYDGVCMARVGILQAVGWIRYQDQNTGNSIGVQVSRGLVTERHPAAAVSGHKIDAKGRAAPAEALLVRRCAGRGQGWPGLRRMGADCLRPDELAGSLQRG